MFPLAMFGLLFRLSTSWSCLMLSWKSSDSFFFLSVGDGWDKETGILSSKWALLTRGVPMEKLWWTGVFPRDGVKSARQTMNITNLMGPLNKLISLHIYLLHSSMLKIQLRKQPYRIQDHHYIQTIQVMELSSYD